MEGLNMNETIWIDLEDEAKFDKFCTEFNKEVKEEEENFNITNFLREFNRRCHE